MKIIISILIVIIVLGTGVYFFSQRSQSPVDIPKEEPTDTLPPKDDTQATTTASDESKTVIGTSVEGREIIAYHYGKGDTELLFVGGVHGGYSWNTVLVAYELMDYLEGNLGAIPDNVKVTVIPVFNPDGLNKIVGTTDRFMEADVPTPQTATIPGRFNANTVDLNRNFDCDWKSTSTWQKTTVSGGSEVFSEPESQAFKTYIETKKPKAVVVWYSAVGGVFASSCHNGVLPETRTLTNLYADASGYKAYQSFDFYDITGDMVNWLAKNSIPAISVLLSTHTDVEWDKNRAGIEALLKYYAK